MHIILNSVMKPPAIPFALIGGSIAVMEHRDQKQPEGSKDWFDLGIHSTVHHPKKSG